VLTLAPTWPPACEAMPGHVSPPFFDVLTSFFDVFLNVNVFYRF